MSKKKRGCKHLNVMRISHGMAKCDFHTDHYRVRGPLPLGVLSAVVDALKRNTVTEAALLRFLKGGVEESNLTPRAESIALKTFMFKRYLPEKKKPEVTPTTYSKETDQVKRLAHTIGRIPLHEIGPQHAEMHKAARLKLKKSHVTINQDMFTLSQVMTYAVACGLIRKNPLHRVRGLPTTDRSSIWLRLKDIARLMRCLPRQVKALAYFLILTGARMNEALAVTIRDIDWRRREIRIPNSKRRRRSRSKGKRMRTLKFDDLGPRFEWLLRNVIKPDLESGHLFPGRFKGEPLSAACADALFRKGVMKAGLEHLIPDHVIESRGHDHVVPHDCRRTFANHGAIAEWSFQKIRNSMGQIHAQSIQAYLDEADGHEPSESIFRHPPVRVRRAQQQVVRPDRDAEESDHGVLQPSYDLPNSPHLH